MHESARYMLDVAVKGDPRVTLVRLKRRNKTINFTGKVIESLPIPEGVERVYYYDVKQKGLMLTVTQNGVKSFCVRRKFQGRAIRVTIGQFPEIPVELARTKALEIATSFALGRNPNIEKNAISQEATFGEFFNQYMEDYSKKLKRTWRNDEWEVNKYLKDWFPYKLSSITKQDVATRHLRVTNNHGLYAANRLLSRIKTIFNKAIEWGWKGENPAKDIKKHREESRERFLKPEELPKFLDALKKEKNKVAVDFFLVALQTGARKTNILKMRWEEISFESGLWSIPKGKSKNGELLKVVLTPSVIKILERRKKENLKRFQLETGWVFPGADAHNHFKEPKMAWQRILTAAGIKDLRIHDLRRTFGSYLAAQGATTSIIGKSLGHRSQESTKVYERLNLDSVRIFVGKTENIFNL